MSYWDQDEFKNDGLYIKLGEGETKVLVFHGHEKRDQKADTDPKFRSPDGKEFVWKFSETVDGKDQDRAYTNAKAGNAFVIAMKMAGIEPGDTMRITRQGSGMETRYTCTKVVDGIETVPEKSENPF